MEVGDFTYRGDHISMVSQVSHYMYNFRIERENTEMNFMVLD